MSDTAESIEHDQIGPKRDCPHQDCAGIVRLLDDLEVWLCSGDPDHAWPEDHWEVPA
jgi:hypothetical protein